MELTAAYGAQGSISGQKQKCAYVSWPLCSRHVIVFLSKGLYHDMKDALTVDVTGILYRWSVIIPHEHVQHLSAWLQHAC